MAAMNPRLILDPINTDNAAFEDDARAELARILRNLATRLEDGSENRGGLYDLNGNRVTGWRLED